MKIGIPKALYYYEYPILFKSFFEALGIEVVLSDDTNKKTLEEGISKSIDEECLASKIFLGHVNNLVSRMQSESIDYIFVPRLCTFKDKKTICVKFYALYDICNNIFNANFITLNIDYEKGENELKSFMCLGKKLGKGVRETFIAYTSAKKRQKEYEIFRLTKQMKEMRTTNNMKILLVSHPYIYNDRYLGDTIKGYLKKLGIDVFFADINCSSIQRSESKKMRYKNISKSIYWKQSIHLLNGVEEYLRCVDGIIYLSVFPCGTDSLVNELAIRKVKDIPSLNIILDEEDGMAGIYTRLESFIDILESKIERSEIEYAKR
ncbi:MAG: acyl-CoA dehydratase activase-related protein [Clostridia bacterium]|nr:acyl-CoA dehydratase activase-related protein [Clostridia bacterium]